MATKNKTKAPKAKAKAIIAAVGAAAARNKSKSAPKAKGEKKASKRDTIRAMLTRKQGTTTKQICEALGWKAISLPPILRALDIKVTMKPNADGVPTYFAKG